MDVSSGGILRDLLGYDFTRSPDGKTVAHVGWIRHFAPPYDQSNYLQLDDTTVYPLPKGRAPKKQGGDEEQPYVVANEGPHYYGIHEFLPGLAWSPDSRRVALIDCIYDWTASGDAATPGAESNRRCAVAVVARDGAFQLVPLADASAKHLYKSRLEWSQPGEVILHIGDSSRQIRIGQP